MPPLRLGERDTGHEPAHLPRVVGLDGGLEALAERGRLAQLASKPAKEAHRRLIGHGCTLAPLRVLDVLRRLCRFLLVGVS